MTNRGMPVEERFWMKVEKTETCWNWTSHIDPLGYGRFSLYLRAKHAHRVAWELTNGAIPEGMEVDHKCRHRGCVRPEHLRLATRKQNMENQPTKSTQSKSGVRGVFWCHKTKKWFGKVGHNNLRYSAGYHETIPEAEAAVIALRNKLHTHNDADRRDS